MGFLKKQNDSETFDFGIDLGTEHSCIAMFDGSGTIIIPLIEKYV
jgi:molecular chaperone DnaK (HSP70)